MPQLFPRYSNSLFALALAAAVSAPLLFFPVRWLIENSSYATNVGIYEPQPVPFSHKHHVGDVGIHCLYCHTSAEKSSFAGIPPVETCMGCHSWLWKDAARLDPVRASYASGLPLQWKRVNNLPDYVYFNHSIHVTRGIGCESCHGRVDEMPLVTKHLAFHMQDCVYCHRQPEKYVRPRSEIYSFGYRGKDEAAARKLMENYGVRGGKALLECNVCHR